MGLFDGLWFELSGVESWLKLKPFMEREYSNPSKRVSMDEKSFATWETSFRVDQDLGFTEEEFRKKLRFLQILLWKTERAKTGVSS